MFGLATSKDNAKSIGDVAAIAGGELNLDWSVWVTVPFSYVASKNSLYARNTTHVRNPIALRRAARAYRDNIGFAIKSAMRGRSVKNNKLWISLYVEKPHNRGDAINVIDLVCDAIKLAVPVDDRWYCIKRLDWSVNKFDPRLFIGLAQEVGVEDSKTCQLCGEIIPLTDFTKNRDSPTGRGGICPPCRRRKANARPRLVR